MSAQVPKDTKVPSSLQNMLKELESDLGIKRCGTNEDREIL